MLTVAVERPWLARPLTAATPGALNRLAQMRKEAGDRQGAEAMNTS
jgi:hypothetical protein